MSENKDPRQRDPEVELALMAKLLPDFQSIFPDALLVHVMHRSGVDATPACARVLGIAMQKFVGDIINDARKLDEMRNGTQMGVGQPKVLTLALVKEVLSRRGINVNPFP